MLNSNERKLLNFIKYLPIFLAIIIGFSVNILIYIQNNINFKKDIEEYKKTYIENQKELVKSQVDKVYNDILIERETLNSDIKKSLKSRTDEAYSIIENIYNTYKSQGNEKVIDIIKTTLRNIRFNENRGYFYIHNMSGKNILHPIKPSLENTNIIDMKDIKGTFIVKKIINNLKINDEYFTSLYWHKPNDLKNEYEKITYNKIFKPLNLIIGTGEYVSDFENVLKVHMIKEHIQKVFYGKNGYVFVIDYDGVYLAHVKHEYINQNRINLKDKNGFEITKEIIKTAKKGSGYIRYIGTIMPETGRPAMKTTYVSGVQDWKWAIATGFYDKELYENLEIKKKQIEKINNDYIKNILLISTVVTIFLILLSFYISKKLEDYFIDYNKKINEEIEINRQKDYLLNQQTKMASMGEMIGNIAHQWRQPLNLISLAASGLKFDKEFGVQDEKKEKEILDSILSSTRYLSETIDDFRNFFQPDKEKININLPAVTSKIIELISSRFKKDDIKVISNIDDITIYTYENTFKQAIINILNNSLDALEDSTLDEKLIFIDIKHEKDCKADFCSDELCRQKMNGGYIKLTIKDNAGGIKDDIIGKIFEVYFTTKHKSKGTGVGLYMTYEIIKKNMSGEIFVNNVEYEYEGKKYKGAEFAIYLSVKD